MTQQDISAQYGARESMSYDIVIVGAGPAGLSSAIRLKQLALQQEREVSVVVLEKGSEPGSHTLSGAVLDPGSLSELLPDWQTMNAPVKQPVTDEALLFLTATGSLRVPNFLLPECSQNHGNYIISLGALTRWLAQQAEQLGVDIFPGFAGSEILYNEAGAVRGVATGNMGLDKNGKPSAHFQPGMELLGQYTIFAEGARGQLGRQLIAKYQLDAGCAAQNYSLGIKELWQVDAERHQPGLVLHSAGWPLDDESYGGSFLYHMEDNKVALGFVTALNYRNPYLNPFEEFQRWKTHPRIRYYLEDATGSISAKRIAYGARAIAAGGLLALPKTVFPGGALVGCAAGFLNASRNKGIHAAIKTGMLAAEAAFAALLANRQHDELSAYPQAFLDSPLHHELYKARNFKSWFKYGLRVGTVMNGLEQFALRGKMPWTIRSQQPDHASLRPAEQCQPIAYPKPDGQLTFDRLSSIFLCNISHAENQPSHLTLKDPGLPVALNLAQYAGPEARYCPAGVYEFVKDESGADRLHINAQNCIHCKTCDIKDPSQNIVWVAPEGGSGPNYAQM